MKKHFTLYLVFFFLQTPPSKSQTLLNYTGEKPGKYHNKTFLILSNTSSSPSKLNLQNLKGINLSVNHNQQTKLIKYYSLPDSIDYNYVTWESKPGFWIATSELAAVQFIPFALAKWGRKWENPEDNWANVSPQTWWRNISQGWDTTVTHS